MSCRARSFLRRSSSVSRLIRTSVTITTTMTTTARIAKAWGARTTTGPMADIAPRPIVSIALPFVVADAHRIAGRGP